jgi:hypothetical protein
MLQVEATWLLTPHDAALVVTGVKNKNLLVSVLWAGSYLPIYYLGGAMLSVKI